MRSYALLGLGSIGGSIAQAWNDDDGTPGRLIGACVRLHQTDVAKALLPVGATIVDDVADLLRLRPDVVIEAAGQGALVEHGASILRAGCDLYMMSVGVLADPDMEASFIEAETACGSKAYLTSGSFAGLDGIRAMRVSGLTSVRYTSRKPPAAWAGTPAERVCDLSGIVEPTTIFEGTAREAALAFPKNANLAAAVALSGLGFDRTAVRLIADPRAEANINSVAAETATNRLTLEMAGRSFDGNGRSAMLAGLSIVAAIRNANHPLAFA